MQSRKNKAVQYIIIAQPKLEFISNKEKKQIMVEEKDLIGRSLDEKSPCINIVSKIGGAGG